MPFVVRLRRIPGLLLIAASVSAVAAASETAPVTAASCGLVVDAARAQIEARFAGKGSRLESKPVSVVPDRICGEIQRIENVKVTGAGEIPSQRVLAIVSSRIDGGKVIDIPIWFAVKASERVVVAGEDLLPGTLLGEVAVAIEEREIQGLGAAPVTSLESFHGARLARRVSAGEVITTRHLEPVPVVQRGQAITLTSRRASIQVATPAVALEDGNIGDVIDGRRADGDQAFRMRIVALDRAEVIRP